MPELGTCPLCRYVHHDPDAHWCRPYDVELAGADERNVTEAGVARCGRRECRMQIVGGREQDTDDVLVVDAVAFDHRGEEINGSLLDLFD